VRPPRRQLAAARVGGSVCRERGRRFALLVAGDPSTRRRDLAAELHTEFALGPNLRVTVATGDDGEDVIARARAALSGTSQGARADRNAPRSTVLEHLHHRSIPLLDTEARITLGRDGRSPPGEARSRRSL
jgi:hypothetical protein